MSLALALFVQDSIGRNRSVGAQVSGVFNAPGWSTVAVYLLLVVGYGHFLFFKPETTLVPEKI